MLAELHRSTEITKQMKNSKFVLSTIIHIYGPPGGRFDGDNTGGSTNESLTPLHTLYHTNLC